MTQNWPEAVLYLTMAFTSVTSFHCLGLFVLLIFIIHRNLSVEAADTSTPKDGVHFYNKYKSLIRQKLSKIDNSELVKEAKLVRILTKNGTRAFSLFFPEGKVAPGSQLFSWRTSNVTTVEDIIVIGIYEKSSLGDFLPFGWMGGTFIALKLADPSVKDRPVESRLMMKYYGVVVYVRKDSNGDQEFELEWDRWSPKAVQNIIRRESTETMAEEFVVETFLCSYGTCACAACHCENPDELEEESDSESLQNESSKKSSGKGRKRKRPGIATSIAHSIDGKAHANSYARGKNVARSGAISGNKAIAESHTNEGRSASFANGKNAALSEASSRTGDTRSVSKTKTGYAQSSSQSYGGALEAAAIRSGEEGETEYNYYDDKEEGDSSDNLDAKSLIQDTSKAFMEASQRAEKEKARTKNKGFIDDVCMKEYATEVNMTLNEWKAIASNPKLKTNATKNPNFLFKNLIRFGVDVDLGINTSVLISSVLPGYIAARKSCCKLTSNPSATVGKFLNTFKQDCDSDFQTQNDRLESFFSDSNIAKVMQTERLTVDHLRDLVPLVLLKVFKNETIRNSAIDISSKFGNKTSDEINLIVAIIIHATDYAMGPGHLHKVKILKGLVLNVRTVLTGIMLETKKCMKEPTLCSESFLERLKNEKHLILGLYYYLKFADTRHSYFRRKMPTILYYDFVKLHDNAIDTLAHCKSRRVILGHSKPKDGNLTITTNYK